jgi:uncharacterized membrane protein (UPF0182 family)
LPDFIDSTQHRSSTWGRGIFFLAALALGVLFCGRIGLSYWVDLLWFESLGYGEVFWKSASLQIIDFVFFAGATFLILYGALSAIRRTHEADLPRARAIVIAGKPLNFSVQPVLRVISFGISIAIACVTGLAMMEDWPTLALFWYAPNTTGSVADPIFGKPLKFFLFTLPAWQLVNNWLLTLAIAICAVAVLLLIITSGARALSKRDVVLLDYDMGDEIGIELLRGRDLRKSNFKILMVTAGMSDDVTLTVLNSGVAGVIFKQSGPAHAL